MRKEFTFEDKCGLRKRLLSLREAVEDKHRLSEYVVEKIMPMLHGNVMVYVSIGSELRTDGLIDKLLNRNDATLFVPYTADEKIFPRRLVKLGVADRRGNLPSECYFGETEAEKRENAAIKLDFCVTPLLGFNTDGYRIGYGKGCYDRLFADNEVYKIGLAFDCQSVEFAPDACDVPLDCCVTDKKVIYFKHASYCR